MAAFSQRMPPVQKLTTVLPASAAWLSRTACGNCVKRSMRQSSAPRNVPTSTSNALRVSSITSSRPWSSRPWASQRRSVAASTAGARPASGRMAGWSMRMISRFTLTSSLRNGMRADSLYLACRSAKRASARSQRRKPSIASAAPARNRLMPSGASSTVPLSWRWPACSSMGSRRSAGLAMLTNL
ncbi:Uncharacterised protein [Bordetella pertussis]|nr:Uncharacterised protein [Bordetella pertussis]CPP34778.1 Uncharacterised protein [Bordetella pertussis]